MTVQLQKYVRPEPTDEQKAEAKKTAEALVRKYGINNLGKMLALLCLENVMLTAEVQEHRAARGFEPMEVHKV
jgi:hypothetical protein